MRIIIYCLCCSYPIHLTPIIDEEDKTKSSICVQSLTRFNNIVVVMRMFGSKIYRS